MVVHISSVLRVHDAGENGRPVSPVDYAHLSNGYGPSGTYDPVRTHHTLLAPRMPAVARRGMDCQHTDFGREHGTGGRNQTKATRRQS